MRRTRIRTPARLFQCTASHVPQHPASAPRIRHVRSTDRSCPIPTSATRTSRPTPEIPAPAPAAPPAPRALDPREPEVRLAALLDEGTAGRLHATDTSGVWAVRGRIDGVARSSRTAPTAPGWAGRWVTRAAGTSSTRSTSPSASGSRSSASGTPAAPGWPRVSRRWTASGQVFAAMVRASGRVPQISVVLGAAAGGAAYGPALTDIVIMAPDGRVFVTGPDVVKSVTGEQVDMEALGGPSAHGRKSGVVHIVADSEADALRRARKVAVAVLPARHRRLRRHDRRPRPGRACCPSSATGPTTSSR